MTSHQSHLKSSSSLLKPLLMDWAKKEMNKTSLQSYSYSYRVLSAVHRRKPAGKSKHAEAGAGPEQGLLKTTLAMWWDSPTLDPMSSRHHAPVTGHVTSGCLFHLLTCLSVDSLFPPVFFILSWAMTPGKMLLFFFLILASILSTQMTTSFPEITEQTIHTDIQRHP